MSRRQDPSANQGWSRPSRVRECIRVSDPHPQGDFKTDTHDTANTTDEEFSDDDLIRLCKLETLLLDRGYARNRHGFWTDAAASTRTAKRKVEP